MRAKSYDAWLLPVHNNEVHAAGHWTQLLIVFNQKSIIYFDSLHQVANEFWISRKASLIERLFLRTKHHPIEWSKWTLYCPLDVPQQGGIPRSSSNCGVHICTWSFILYSGAYIKFYESDMNRIRAWILHLLTNLKHPKGSSNLIYDTSSVKTVLKPTNIAEISRTRQPPNYFATTLGYASSLKTILQAMKT